jgi:hypothetical protein
VRLLCCLSRDHAGAQLERIWGPGDGRPVADLKVAVDQLLQEFLSSGLHLEAAACIKELSAAHFHHEIVKRAISNSLDRSDELRNKMSDLLAYLVGQEVVSQQQAIKGFRRVYGILSDLKVGAPPLVHLSVYCVTRMFGTSGTRTNTNTYTITNTHIYILVHTHQLDTPNARALVNEFTVRAVADGVLTKDCLQLTQQN